MIISEQNLRQWKLNSIRTARKIGCDSKILGFLNSKTRLKIIKSAAPPRILYGFCHYGSEPVIEVYHQNSATERINEIEKELRIMCVDQNTIKTILEIRTSIKDKDFFEVYNQSGMDHELIGHAYNYYAKKSHDERAACQTQILLAKARANGFFGRNWKKILKIMPIILQYHKNIDEL